MEDINKTLKDIKETRRRITRDIERMSADAALEDVRRREIEPYDPDDRSVWAVSFISKQRELDMLKALVLKKEHEAHELSLKLKTLEHRLYADQAIWEKKIQLKEEELKVRLLTLENQNEYLRGENSIIKENLHKQLEDEREQKNTLERELAALRSKHGSSQNELYELRACVEELRRAKESLEKMLAKSEAKIQNNGNSADEFI